MIKGDRPFFTKPPLLEKEWPLFRSVPNCFLKEWEQIGQISFLFGICVPGTTGGIEQTGKREKTGKID